MHALPLGSRRTTLIHVKRKRDEDFDDALLIAKRRHLDSGSSAGAVPEAFYRVGSLSQSELQGSSVAQNLKDRISAWNTGGPAPDESAPDESSPEPDNSPRPDSPRQYQVVLHDPVLAQAQLERHFNIIGLERVPPEVLSGDANRLRRTREAQNRALQGYYQVLPALGLASVPSRDRVDDFVYDVYAKMSTSSRRPDSYSQLLLDEDDLVAEAPEEHSPGDICDQDSNASDNPAFDYPDESDGDHDDHYYDDHYDDDGNDQYDDDPMEY